MVARIEDKGNYLPVTVANNIEEVISNMQMLIQDYLVYRPLRSWTVS